MEEHINCCEKYCQLYCDIKLKGFGLENDIEAKNVSMLLLTRLSQNDYVKEFGKIFIKYVKKDVFSYDEWYIFFAKNIEHFYSYLKNFNSRHAANYYVEVYEKIETHCDDISKIPFFIRSFDLYNECRKIIDEWYTKNGFSETFDSDDSSNYLCKNSKTGFRAMYFVSFIVNIRKINTQSSEFKEITNLILENQDPIIKKSLISLLKQYSNKDIFPNLKAML